MLSHGKGIKPVTNRCIWYASTLVEGLKGRREAERETEKNLELNKKGQFVTVSL